MNQNEGCLSGASGIGHANKSAREGAIQKQKDKEKVQWAELAIDQKIPLYILAIFDNGGITTDRYTVVLSDVDSTQNYKSHTVDSLNLSSDCNSPNGMCYWSDFDFENYNDNVYNNIGKTILFADLPVNVQRTIQQKRRDSTD